MNENHLTPRTNHNLFYENLPVRVIRNEDGSLWFVAKDICDILDLGTEQIRRLDEDEKGLRKMQTPGGEQELSIISESGLYTLVIRSNKPQAKPFRRWVTHEVLPAIRRNGYYGEPPETVNQIIVERIDKLEEAVQNMQLSHHASGTVLYFVHYCCQTGYQRQMISKAALYQAYIHYCTATRCRPECLAHFCMKLYASIAPAGKASMTISGKRVAAVRGVSLLNNYRQIISDLNHKYMEKDRAELARRREYYFGIKADDDKQMELFPSGVLGNGEGRP